MDAELRTLPPLWRASAAAIWRGALRWPRGPFRPRVRPARVEIARVGFDPDRVAAYRRVCGWPRDPAAPLPSTFPFLVCAPLAATAMAQRSFPYPLPGVLHVRQQIVCRRPIAVQEQLSASARFGQEREVARGVELDVHAALCDGEDPVWEGITTALFPDPERRRHGGRPAPPEEGLASARLSVPADQGRRYARVSGDWNPIHLWPATARAFGHPRPIAHGMWALARGLADERARWPDAFGLVCEFRRPLPLPGEVRIFRFEDPTGFGFSWRDPASGRKILECTVRPAAHTASG